VLGHLGLNVPDLESARAYYGELMPLLGFESFIDDPDQFAFMPSGSKPGTYLFFYPTGQDGAYSREATGLQHVAFMVPTRSAVRAVFEKVSDLGGRILHQPQEFPQYLPPYYATFWLDPFGFMLEAVCHHDRD
jgi:catechol 2,3-dioxygenase-like lactoylglutathione lyase family enzyme